MFKMKFACKVQISNRNLNVPLKNRYVNATVALCTVPKSTDYCIILFTSKDKNGTKYPLRDNVRNVLTRFVKEGKATLQFLQPPHDLFIQADVIQLKSFLHLLKAALERKLAAKQAPYSALSVTPISAKNMMVKKLVIKQRSDYPIKGFPRTLETLYINDIKRCALDKGILLLCRLRVLDVSNNCIEYLPEELNKLPGLRELNVSSNHLHKATCRQWRWMGGNLSSGLVSLNLADNSLITVPDDLVKLHALEYLNLQNNLVQQLPLGIGRLKRLRIFMCSDNRLSTLPGSIKNLRLQVLSLANNPFEPLHHDSGNLRLQRQIHQVWTLKECSGRRVLSCKLPYCSETLPATLVNFLDHAKYCVCGEACFTVFFKQSMTLALSSISSELTMSPGDDGYVPIDGYFCSLSCYDSCKTRYRGHIIR